MPAIDTRTSPDAEADRLVRDGVDSAYPAAADAPQIDQLCDALCNTAMELLHAEGACIAVFDPMLDRLRLSISTGSLLPLRGVTFPAEGSVSGLALQRGRPFIDNDLLTSSAGRYARELPVSLESALAVPLHGWEGTTGTLVVVNRLGGGFSPDDAKLLEGYALPVALALHGADRWRETDESRITELELRRERDQFIGQLRRLHEAELKVTSDMSLLELLQAVAEQARDLTGACRAALGLLSEDASAFDRFVMSESGGSSPSPHEPSEDDFDILAAVIDSNRPVCVRFSAEAPCSCGDVPTGHDPMSFLGIPILLEGRTFGILYLTEKEGGQPFTKRDEALIQMLAAQAAVAILKAHLVEALRETVDSLEASRRVRTRLYAYVNHDLRNALHGVAMWTERLAQLARSPEPRVGLVGLAERTPVDLVGLAERTPVDLEGLAERISRGTERAQRLVRDVLDLTTLDEGRLETWPRRFKVLDLLRSAAEAVTPEAEESRLHLSLSCEDGLTLVADPDRTQQIIVNLLSNAVKFSTGPDTVDVEAARSAGPAGEDRDWVRISVRDRGPGIAPDNVAKIFEPYERGADEERRRQGTGLGLALSRYLAEHMEGALTVDTIPGQGSTFSLWLPADRAPRARPGWIG